MQTFQEIRKELRSLGMNITKTGWGSELRVVPECYKMAQHEKREAVAYYTDDLQDALDTGKRMSKELGYVK